MGDLSFDSPKDFQTLIPETLPETFTAKIFSGHLKLRSRDAYLAIRALAIRALAALGLIVPTDPIGKARAWKAAAF